ncbi:PEX19 [Candida pseudojiufengensis]|uniref:PEX19 n=1 Tax=Candida pseudojiufengensis TaxID=497109 RepID=UPI0022242BA5|nr:PEX19 [Candida pseudojiufengensis]KAI5962602.1 PEX19 [Candida pseudojiufengensis]
MSEDNKPQDLASITDENAALKSTNNLSNSKNDSTTNPTTEKSQSKANTEDVDDLDDLLDDFADEVLSKPPGSTAESQQPQTSQPNSNIKTQPQSQTDPLNEDFQNSISELIKDMKIEDPETQKQFETLVKQFETNHRQEIETEESKPANFEYVMKETMERLKKSGEDIDSKIKNDSMGSNPEDLLTQLLAGMGGDSALGGGDMDMSKLLVDMLEQLSSKEVLYEPIKDLNKKFPQYLKDNKDKLGKKQYENYNNQYEITNDILKVFDSENYNDANKQQRDQINSMLESLQELGQPPTELVGETGDFLPGFGGGAGGAGGFDFNDKNLPPDLEKNLQEGCQQQ